MNVSVIDLELALSGDRTPEIARIPLVRPADPDGVRRARPKGSAVTADGRYAVISGGPRTTFEPSGVVYIIDLRTRAVVGAVTGVGNDPYGLAVTRCSRPAIRVTSAGSFSGGISSMTMASRSSC